MVRVIRWHRLVAWYWVCAAACPPLSAAERVPQHSYAPGSPDKATVYFIREGRFSGGGRTAFVYADRAFAGVLDNNCYTFAEIEPGKRLLWLNWAKINREVELEGAKTYYFTVWTSFDPVDEGYGRALIEKIESYCRPTAKESATSAEHIAERYGKATAVAAKKPEGEQPASSPKTREKNIAKWPRVDLAAYDTLYLEDWAMADPKAGERKKALLVEFAPRRVPDTIARDLGEVAFALVNRGPAPDATAGVLVLRGKFTQYKPGSETARLMIAGAGAARLDFAVELVDAADGKVLARIADERTFAWGGAYGASRGIEEIEKNVAWELAEYLRRARGVAPQEAEVGGSQP